MLAPAPHLSRLRGRSDRTAIRARDLFPEERTRTPPSPASGRGSAQRSGKGNAQDAQPLTPHALAAARAEAARKVPLDRNKYQTIRDLDQLNAWIARVHDVGHFAIDAKASSIDPMQAEMCGIALALAPNDAAYVPLSHKQSGDGAGLFAAGLAPDQIKAADALEALRPLLESAGILKIGFNIKFNAVMFAQHGITIRNHDDAQLMSYALDAGRNSHGLDELAERWLGHATMSYGELTGSGKGQTQLRSGRDRQGDRIFGRGCRCNPAAMACAQTPSCRRAHDRGL